jgi:hypothetical protein
MTTGVGAVTIGTDDTGAGAAGVPGLDRCALVGEEGSEVPTEGSC